MGYSISLNQGTMTSLSHNNRENTYGNPDIDLSRSGENFFYLQQDIREAYDEVFGESVAEYNEKQTRKDRRIENYYEKVRLDKKTEPQRELIVAIGSKEDGEQDIEWKKKALDRYAKSFQAENPNLKVYNMVMHNDEANPHLHINYVPYYESNRGLGRRVANNKALKAQGIEGKDDRELMKNWRDQETARLEAFSRELNSQFDRDSVGSHKYMKVPQYKAYAEEIQDLKVTQEIYETNVEFLDDKITKKTAELAQVDRVLDSLDDSPVRARKYYIPDKNGNTVESHNFVLIQKDDLLAVGRAKKHIPAFQQKIKQLEERNSSLEDDIDVLRDENHKLYEEIGTLEKTLRRAENTLELIQEKMIELLPIKGQALFGKCLDHAKKWLDTSRSSYNHYDDWER